MNYYKASLHLCENAKSVFGGYASRKHKTYVISYLLMRINDISPAMYESITKNLENDGVTI